MNKLVLSPIVAHVDAPSADIRIKKLTGSQMVNVAAAHNKRERWSQQSTNSQCSTVEENEVVCGPSTATAVADDARRKILQAGITKIRKNAVYAIELIATLKSGTGIDEHAFFIDCLSWVAVRFGGPENVLSADIHRDEAEPHIHILLLPLVDGRMRGSDLVGGPGKFRGHRQSFSQDVCQKHGLSIATRVLRGVAKRAAANWILARLIESKDAIISSAVWQPVKKSIARDPEPYLSAVGSSAFNFLTHVELRTVAEIFTSRGKGPTQAGCKNS